VERLIGKENNKPDLGYNEDQEMRMRIPYTARARLVQRYQRSAGGEDSDWRSGLWLWCLRGIHARRLLQVILSFFALCTPCYAEATLQWDFAFAATALLSMEEVKGVDRLLAGWHYDCGTLERNLIIASCVPG
jgi:hypothetical protein